MVANQGRFNVLERIKAHLDHIHPVLPNRIALTVGQYAFKAMKDSKRFGIDHTPTLLHILHRKEVDLKTIEIDTESDIALVFDTVFEPHYWFDTHAYLEEDMDFIKALRTRIFNYHNEVIVLGFISEGVTSGVLPTLNSHLIREGKNAMFLTIFPSMSYSSDALFNAYSSIGLLFLNDAGPVILLDHSYLEGFTGVNRVGDLLTGVDAVDYLVELFLNEKGRIRDLTKLSESFKVGLYTVLMSSGASLEIYETFGNILDITLEQPMLDFNLSTASLIYVIVRAPLWLKERLSKGYIELEVNGWLKKRANVDIPQICEVTYVESFNDRVDVVILVGGFQTKQLFKTMDQRISRFNSLIVENELYDKDTWNKIRSRLMQN